jgi:uncharacterized protein YunC (DUF1805 family)
LERPGRPGAAGNTIMGSLTLTVRSCNEAADMQHESIKLSHKTADGYVVPAGPFNIVNIHTDHGMVGCGAFDVLALDKFNYPAARVSGVATLEDVLAARVNLVNKAAEERGVTVGMTGREALERL